MAPLCCREFGLLVKQMLYFDRYVRLLAPELQVLQDSRVSLGDLGSNGGPAGPGTQGPTYVVT